MRLSGRDLHVVVQKLRRKVSAVGPDERMKFRMNREGLKVRRVPQRLEHRATQCRAEVNLSGRPITEPQPHEVSPGMAGFENMVIHRVTGERASTSRCQRRKPI